jgi:hypothetical protein
VEHHHVQVEALAQRGFVASGTTCSIMSSLELWSHGLSTVLQDRYAAFVIPVVDDPGQHLRIPALRYGFEEVAGDDPASISYAGCGEDSARPFDDRRPVEKYPFSAPAGFQDFSQEGTVPPPMSMILRHSEKS